MPEGPLSSDNVTNLIDHLLKTKDPATVGLRRILKKKEKQAHDFPLQAFTLEDFNLRQASGKAVFTENEQQVLELEKKVLMLEGKLVRQKKKSEKAIQEAYKTGIGKGAERGEKEGYERAAAEFEQKIADIEERLAEVLVNIDTSRKSLFREAHKTLLDLSILIARKIIDTEILVNPDIVLSVIKKALTHLADRQEFTALVSPNDISAVTERRDFWTQISDRLENISVKEDDRIEQGGCIIESNSGVIDARINTQIEELIELINSTWESVITSEESGKDRNYKDQSNKVQNEMEESTAEVSEVEEDMEVNGKDQNDTGQSEKEEGFEEKNEIKEIERDDDNAIRDQDGEIPKGESDIEVSDNTESSSDNNNNELGTTD